MEQQLSLFEYFGVDRSGNRKITPEQYMSDNMIELLQELVDRINENKVLA